MLNGIETIFDNTTQMLRHLKKKSFEKNTQDFISELQTSKIPGIGAVTINKLLKVATEHGYIQ